MANFKLKKRVENPKIKIRAKVFDVDAKKRVATIELTFYRMLLNLTITEYGGGWMVQELITKTMTNDGLCHVTTLAYFSDLKSAETFIYGYKQHGYEFEPAKPEPEDG